MPGDDHRRDQSEQRYIAPGQQRHIQEPASQQEVGQRQAPARKTQRTEQRHQQPDSWLSGCQVKVG